MTSEETISMAALYSPADHSPSTSRLRAIARHARTPYVFVNLTRRRLSMSAAMLERLAEVARATRAAMIYTDYYEEESLQRLRPCQEGSVDAGFSLGHGVLIDTGRMRAALAKAGGGFGRAGVYDLRLRLMRAAGGVFHLPEPLYVSLPSKESAPGGVADYADTSDKEYRRECIQALSSHMRATGTWRPVPAAMEAPGQEAWPVRASVVIPAVNCDATSLEKTIKSALSQKAPFDFNILVVTPHVSETADDAVAAMVRKMSIDDARIVRIEPRRAALAAGGCWNEAAGHRLCGTYAVRLDAGMEFGSTDALSAISDTFAGTGAGVVALKAGGPSPVDAVASLLAWPSDAAHVAFATVMLRRWPVPNVDQGWDFAAALRISRACVVAEITDGVYAGNVPCGMSAGYADTLCTLELMGRMAPGRYRTSSDS